MRGDPWKPCRSGTGAALVIVLAFIVLIAALMVIFFTQAISYRNQGNSSFNNFKSTALAQSGLATVVGDLGVFGDARRRQRAVQGPDSARHA